MLNQIFAILALNFRNLRQRLWPSLVVVVGMACVVGVLLSMLSFTLSLTKTYSETGEPDRALVLAPTAQKEAGGALPRNYLPLIAEKPGVATGADGKPLAEAEAILVTNVPRRVDAIPMYVSVRGMGPHSIALRPKFKLIAGRMFRPGAREVIVGRSAQNAFAGTDIGDKIILPDGQWPVVGVFTMGGDITESLFLADRDTLMGAGKRKNYNSVLVRLTSPAAYTTFRQAVLSDPTLAVAVERQTDYYDRFNGDITSFLTAVAYIVAAIMAVGALFAALNTMYAAVSARTREIATLRALGFGALPVILSVITEALALTITGALIGAAIAWIVFDGNQTSSGNAAFNLSVSPYLVGIGVAWAVVVGLMGSLLPSIHAARQPVATALRAT